MIRRCKKCGEEKDIALFVKDKSCTEGRRFECKSCHNKKFNKGIGTGKNPNSGYKIGHKSYSYKGMNKGKHFSPNTEFKKGVIPWSKGITLSNDIKSKISAKLTGRTLGKKVCEKMSEGQKKRVSEGRHNNYKGGITPINHSARISTLAKWWRKECLARDNFTCQKTKVSGGYLEVHHINNFAEFPELRFDVNNGITLSKDAHRIFHTLYSFKNNTRQQLEEFLNNDNL